MKKSGKNIEKARKAVEPRPYTLQEAVPLLQKVKYAKFDETVEVTLRLGVDPKHADQMVRGTVVLPHGLGKSKKVLVIASGEKVRDGVSNNFSVWRVPLVRPHPQKWGTVTENEGARWKAGVSLLLPQLILEPLARRPRRLQPQRRLIGCSRLGGMLGSRFQIPDSLEQVGILRILF